ncbi:HPr kinase/phosphorylase [Brevundimonas aurifodinae]|uniref:Serine kinase n=2 Tax=Brevundimonas TaxID=41275 RepID=A0ABV1NS66_9CAUL|nr:MAG: serine kinase [Brevundimonas sp. 12-68-7]OYX32330.1 MAG: serine kinase [Brevundimonas subvibrioides]
MNPPPVHATAVALRCADGWRGALLRGPSGAGKSDLALRLMAGGWRLVGDDYVHVFTSGGHPYAAPADRIAGRIEARGLGILRDRHLPLARVRLVVDCVQEAVERLPGPAIVTLAGAIVPALKLDIRAASSVALLAHAMRRL